MDKYIASQRVDLNNLAALAELQTMERMKPGFGERLMNAAGQAAGSYFGYKGQKEAREAQELQQAREAQQKERQFVAREGLLPIQSTDGQTPVETPPVAYTDISGQQYYRPEGPQAGRQYAKQLKLVGDYWLIFDPATGEYRDSGLKASVADRERPMQLKTVRDTLGNTTLYRWNPNIGALEEVFPGGQKSEINNDPLKVR